MSAVQFNISDLSPAQVVALQKAGLIEVNGTTAPPSSGRKPRARKPKINFGLYSTYLKGQDELFSALHPVIRRGAARVHGSTELRAKLNMLVVTGTCKLSAPAYDALGRVMSRNGLGAKSVSKNGKVISRFYSAKMTKAGVVNGSTTPFFTGGGRIRVDHRTRTAELVGDFAFAPEQVAAISQVIETL